MTTRNERWEKIGEGAAAELRITPQQIKYIEARGFLCYELQYLLSGRIEFVRTPWKNFVLKILEFIFSIALICRWYPPENSELEWVGHDLPSETKVYRFTPEGSPKVIFFVEYEPDRPAAGTGSHIPAILFKVPQLDDFLQPPFEKNIDEAKDPSEEIKLAQSRGLWRGFTER